MWISSTESSKWVKDGRFTASNGTEIVIGGEKGKPIFGFGACFSELGQKAIFSLSDEKKKAVYDDLFGRDGCGFTFCRLSVGANDFAESWYSYNEVDGDLSMEHFSIDRDRKYVIPAIKEAQKRCPSFLFLHLPGVLPHG